MNAREVSILIKGGGWVTNIGNAFLDIGLIGILKKCLPQAHIFLLSNTPYWLNYEIKKNLFNKITKKLFKKDLISMMFNVQEFIEADYVVIHGACLGTDWFDRHGETLRKIVRNGAKLLIIGGSLTDRTYENNKEIEFVKKYLEKLKPLIFISRDERTFENFKDIAEYSYNGIDCAFFINDVFIPPTLNCDPFIIFNFDKTPEPKIKNLDIPNDVKIIRTHHSFLFNKKVFFQYYTRDNMLISEFPYEYLILYANAQAVYSDRVHACVTALVYNVPARLFSKTGRASLFDRIGIKGITKELVKADISKIEEEKNNQIKFLQKILPPFSPSRECK